MCGRGCRGDLGSSGREAEGAGQARTFRRRWHRGWRGGEGQGDAGRPDLLAVGRPLRWMPEFKAEGSKPSLLTHLIFFVCFRN